MLAVTDFIKNPLTFLNNNILVIGFDAFSPNHVTPSSGVELFKFVQLPKNRALGSQLGESKPVYQLIPTNKADPGTLEAYWCPYKQNDTLGIVLGHEADFMFTATMDGCTLGLGSQGADGSTLVYHSNLANMGSANNPHAQGEAQRTTLNMMYGASGHTLFEPGAYRFEYGQNILSSTTIGARSRDTRKWHFWSQVYLKDATKMPCRYFLRKVQNIR